MRFKSCDELESYEERLRIMFKLCMYLYLIFIQTLAVEHT